MQRAATAQRSLLFCQKKFFLGGGAIALPYIILLFYGPPFIRLHISLIDTSGELVLYLAQA